MVINKNTIASFTWIWNINLDINKIDKDKFFLEIKGDGFIWSDPKYGGNNTIKPVHMTYEEYCSKNDIGFGCHRGDHIISEYCGNDVIFIDC